MSAGGSAGQSRADDLASSSAIAVDGMVVRYGGMVAVDGVSFSLPSGRVLALLRPNGAGKTSIVECCEGYRAVDGETVRVLGVDPHARHDWLMRAAVPPSTWLVLLVWAVLGTAASLRWFRWQ